MIGTRRHLGAAVRMSIILLYGAIAFLVAERLGRTDPFQFPTLPDPTANPPGRSLRLKIDCSASRPVENWLIMVDGVPVDGAATTGHRWRGETDLAPRPDQRLTMDATPSPSSADSPLAVRLQVSANGENWEQTFWAPDELVESVPLDPLWKAWEVTP